MSVAFTDDVDCLRRLTATAVGTLAGAREQRKGPLPEGGPAAIDALLDDDLGPELLPERGIGDAPALERVGRVLVAGSADPTHPAAAAHLHCPPLAVAVAAETIAAASNQSVDSWDQGPAAIALERQVVATLTGLVGFDPAHAGGVLTTGGSESNLMGLLLAREAARRPRVRVFCSQLAHFSIARAAAVLGLGHDAVVGIRTDADHRIDLAALREALARTRNEVDTAPVLVATAGTTEFGSIDPLPPLAALAREYGAWLHVDAAYGGGVLFSARLSGLLEGIAAADSVSLDFHKFGWLPIAAGVFLARDRDSFAPLDRTVDYLNSSDDEEEGFGSLLGFSLRTTRRADAVKLATAMLALGRTGFGALVERCHDIATYAAEAITAHPRLRLVAAPALTTVVFSYDADPSVNPRLRRRLLEEGSVIVGRARANGHPCAKFTFLNPRTERADVDHLVEAVAVAGAQEDR